MLQGSQSHLLHGSGISAITKQQVEANQKGQRVGQYAQQHAFMIGVKVLELLKEDD
jgi:phage gp16-like protein